MINIFKITSIVCSLDANPNVIQQQKEFARAVTRCEGCVDNIAAWPDAVIHKSATGFDRLPLSASRAVTPPCRQRGRAVSQSVSQSHACVSSVYNVKCFGIERRQSSRNIEISQAITILHAATSMLTAQCYHNHQVDM